MIYQFELFVCCSDGIFYIFYKLVVFFFFIFFKGFIVLFLSVWVVFDFNFNDVNLGL